MRQKNFYSTPQWAQNGWWAQISGSLTLAFRFSVTTTLSARIARAAKTFPGCTSTLRNRPRGARANGPRTPP